MKFNEAKLPSNKKFGLFFSIVFFSLSFYFTAVKIFFLSIIFIFFSIIFFLLAITKASLLLPLNKIWFRFGILLSYIVSPVILGIVYFGIFFPLAIVLKILKRDELKLNAAEETTFWKKSNTNNKDIASFKNQF
tara:strand:- start:5048 stop:5449 length:402 start_codon:yes stop_codon:yes gene_type:complete